MTSPSSPKNLPNDLKSQLEGFNTDNMKKADTNEKIVLPTAEDVAAEKTQKALIDDVEGFDTGKLKHAKTQEKNPLPDKFAIEAEKEQQQLIAGIENFDTTKLKHTETLEKNPLPTKEAIDLEKKSINGRSERTQQPSHLLKEDPPLYCCYPAFYTIVRPLKTYNVS
uniref:Thymosin beta n=1 Tax=Graphocephala atropunctata TaxID=36148 RepID=A0A1B6KZA1_9HEMI